MSRDQGFKILFGELAGVPWLRLFVEKRALHSLLASPDPDNVLILETVAMRVEVSSHAGRAAVDAAARDTVEKLALFLRQAEGAA